MSKTNSVYQYEQPRLPDGWNESERRFYNRLIQVLDDIYSKYGRIDEKMLSKTVINKIETATDVTLQKMVADIISAGVIATDSLAATFMSAVSLTAKYGSYDFQTVKDLVASALVVEKGQADQVHITNLTATYLQAVSAAVGNLCIKAEDGRYYQIRVNSDGTVEAEPVEAPADEEISAGETQNGKVIIESSISAESMTTDTVFATQALLNKITAELIDVDSLIAREAFIQALTANTAFLDQLFANQAFVDHLNTTDISSNSYIRQSIAGEVGRFARLDEKGLHIGDANAASEVLIDAESVNVVMAGQNYSKFASNYVQFGNYQIRRTADGGMAFGLEGD